MTVSDEILQYDEAMLLETGVAEGYRNCGPYYSDQQPWEEA